MSFKDWFSRHPAAPAPGNLTVDDLLARRRFDEAIEMMEERAKMRPRDTHLKLKLADLLASQGRAPEAIETYLKAVDLFAEDGFYDRALGLVAKVLKLDPASEEAGRRAIRLEQARIWDRKRSLIERALASSSGADRQRATTAIVEGKRLCDNLRESHLLERLNNDQLRRLFSVLEIVQVASDEQIMRREQQCDEMFVVAEGAIHAEAKLPNGGTTTLREHLPGDLFGDRALFERKPWPATYRARGSSVILKLDRKSLENALKGNPDPRELIDILREARFDDQVALAVARLEEN